MKISSSAAAALLAGATFAEAFSIQSAVPRIRQSTLLKAAVDEFDSILGEGSSYVKAANSFSRKSSSPIVRVPDGSPVATVTLASSVAAPAEGLLGDDLGLEDDLGLGDLESAIGETTEEISVDDNPLLKNEILKRQHEKALKKQQFKESGGVMKYVKNPYLLIKGKDFSDITVTVIIPATLTVLALRKVGEVVGGKLNDVAENNYQVTASKMAFHAGDIEEMQLLFNECMKKNWFQGANTYKGPELFKKVVQYFLKMTRISPATVSSLQYLAPICKITDDEICEYFNELGTVDELASATPLTLMYLSERLVKNKSSKKLLRPMLNNLTERFSEDIVTKLVSDIGVQAYRDAIAEAGKDQTKMTEGWKVLGLDKETATQIFEESRAKGFMTLKEELKDEQRREEEREIAERAAAAERLRNMFDEEGNVIEDDDEDDDDDDED